MNLLPLIYEVHRAFCTAPDRNLYSFPDHRFVQTLGNALVGRPTKQDEGHQGLWIIDHSFWIGLYWNQNFCSGMRYFLLIA